MGTTLTAAIQVQFPANEHRDEIWQTIAIFELGKQYEFMIWLSDNGQKVNSKRIGSLYKPDNDWPDECDDCYNYRIVTELPAEFEYWIPYAMLRGAQLAHKEFPTRILTWTDQ